MENKRDFIVPSRVMEFHPKEKGVEVLFDHPDVDHPIDVSDHALGQFSNWGKVPIAYLRKLKEQDPDFMAAAMNRELINSNDSRMLRTYMDDSNGYLRAWLSRSYGRFGPQDLLMPLLELFHANPGKWTITECAFTEHGFVLNAVMPTELFDIRVGDPVAFGIRAYTGETGMYATGIDAMIHRLVCTNTMTAADRLTGFGYRRVHKGKAAPARLFEMSQETQDAEQHFTQLQLRDTVRGMMQEGAFKNAVDKMRLMANTEVQDPLAATELLADNAGLTEGETKAMQNSMISGGDTTVWGLQNALTDMARDLEDYDRKRNLEAFAGAMLTTSVKKYQEVKLENINRKRKRRQ